jgi:hypothetical protein
LSNITQTTVDVAWTDNSDHGASITDHEIRWGTDPTGVVSDTETGVTSPWTVEDLTPGSTYYFWVRAQNAVGWGAWSPPQSTTAIAGVRLKYGGVWKQAIPYVNDAGVWRLVRPWAKNFGVWKETI